MIELDMRVFIFKVVMLLLSLILICAYSSEHEYFLPSGSVIKITKPDDITLEQMFHLTTNGIVITEGVEISYELDNYTLSRIGLSDAYNNDPLIHVISEWMITFSQGNSESPSEGFQTNLSSIAFIDPYLDIVDNATINPNNLHNGDAAAPKASTIHCSYSNVVSVDSSIPSHSLTRGRFKCIFKDCYQGFNSPNKRCNHHKTHLKGFKFDNTCPLCSKAIQSISSLLQHLGSKHLNKWNPSDN